MGNHLHLLIKEGNEKIGNNTRRIGVSYAYWYNRQYDRSGHLFQGRFKSEPIEDDTYFLTVLRYIRQNPVKAGLVSDIEDYKWSSYNGYYKTSNIVDTNFALQMFSSDEKEALAEFGKFHMETTDSRCPDIDEKKKHFQMKM